jgi:hypothetical protein
MAYIYLLKKESEKLRVILDSIRVNEYVISSLELDNRDLAFFSYNEEPTVKDLIEWIERWLGHQSIPKFKYEKKCIESATKALSKIKKWDKNLLVDVS